MIKNIQNILPSTKVSRCYSEDDVLTQYFTQLNSLKNEMNHNYLDIRNKCKLIKELITFESYIYSSEELNAYRKLSTEAKSIIETATDILTHIKSEFTNVKSFFQDINKKNIAFYNKTLSANEKAGNELVSLIREYNSTKSNEAIKLISDTAFCLPSFKDTTAIISRLPAMENYISDFINHIKFNTSIPNAKCLNELGYDINKFFITSKNAIRIQTSINKLSATNNNWGWNGAKAIDDVLLCAQKLNSVIYNISSSSKTNITNVITDAISEIDRFIHNSSLGSAKDLQQTVNAKSVKLSYVMNINYITQSYISQLSVLLIDALKNMNNINKYIKH